MDAWAIGTDSAKAVLKEKDLRQRIKASAMQWWIRPTDITAELLREKGVFNTEEIMQVVRKLICEFYGISMWELARNDKEFLMDKYWIPEDKFNVLREWDVALAYQEFAKHNNWDNTGLNSKDTPDAVLPSTTTVVDLPEETVKKEEWHMLEQAKQNLQKMMDSETDKEKLDELWLSEKEKEIITDYYYKRAGVQNTHI